MGVISFIEGGGCMGRYCFGALLIGVVVLLVALPVRAHHSAAAAFDATKPVTVTGLITEVRLENPHTWFFVDVTDQSGKVVNWGFEGTTPTALIRSGFKRDALKPGDRVTIRGVHARDMSQNRGAAREIVLLQTGQSFIVGGGGDGNQ
jgi:DNA/RNA endonuclease YhcR with UshA esterase domain